MIALAQSPHAAVIGADMHRELARLLHGAELEQDLLGLVTAACGGLSAQDLAELTGQSAWQVAERLGTVAGRSFDRRASQWLPDEATADVYILGDETLEAAARRVLGVSRLDGYRQRLHAWAYGYRRRSWPAGTPEYLLQGYYQMLNDDAMARDLSEMVACATDAARHDRMLDVTGGYAAALAEITTAQDLVLAQHDPDPLTMARLAIHRDVLTGRSGYIPIRLPAVWAALGRLTRAETLAQSIAEPSRQAESLAVLAEIVADVDLGRACKLAIAITCHDRQADALASLARKVTVAQLPWVEELARAIGSISDASRRAEVLASLVESVAGVDSARAEELAASVTDPVEQTAALAALLKVLAGTDPDRARLAASRAEALASSLTEPIHLAVLADLARTVARIDTGQARALFDRVETLVGAIADPEDRARVLAWLTPAVATVDQNRAEDMAGSITSPVMKAVALATLAEELAGTDPKRARALVIQADALARTTRI